MSELRLQYKWVVRVEYSNGSYMDWSFKTRREAREWKRSQPKWIQAEYEIYKVNHFPNLKATLLIKAR